MTLRIDHVAEARKHIDWAHERQAQEGDTGNVPRDDALLAQAEATLALVEQQRIANLIALGEQFELVGGPDVWQQEHVLREDIRGGLGL